MTALRNLLLALLVVIGMGAACSASTPTSTADLVVVVSPYAPAAVARQEHDLLYALLLRDAPPGASVSLWDGYGLARVFEAKIPALRYDGPEARAERMVEALLSLDRWFNRGSAPQAPGELLGGNEIRLPELVAEIGLADLARPRRLLILGSPFYVSSVEPTFSMADANGRPNGRYPSDAHVAATAGETVFGAAGREQALSGSVIYWAYGSESQWLNGAHKLAVQRWWSIWTSAQSGVLAGFSSNAQMLVERLLAGDIRTESRFTCDPRESKIRMLSAAPRQAPIWLDVPDPVVTPPPAPPAPVALPPVVTPRALPTVREAPKPLVPQQAPPPPAPLVAPPLPPARFIQIPVPIRLDDSKIGIGIAWPADWDLDLYVRAAPGKKEVYYRDDRSPEAFLYSDERHGNFGGQFEFVEFTKPSEVNLKAVEVWVNFYAGRSSTTTKGQVVLFDRGTIKIGTFVIPATHGNHGGSRTNRAESPYWVKINLDQLVSTSQPLAASRPRGSQQR